MTEAIEMIKRVNESVHPTQRVRVVVGKWCTCSQRLWLAKCFGRMEHI